MFINRLDIDKPISIDKKSHLLKTIENIDIDEKDMKN